MENYDAVKSGLGLTDRKIYFLVPMSVAVKPYHPALSYYQWCLYMFRLCSFLGTREGCERNMVRYPEHRLEAPQFDNEID